MAKLLLVLFVMMSVCYKHLLQVSAWGYHGNHGPANWYKTYPNCNKNRQSPIEMTPENSKYTTQFKKFVFNNYQTTSSSNFLLFNNGHTVQLTVSDPGNMTVNAFDQTFKPWQIHFHWGKTDNEGSEHRTRNSHHHPAEMHFVHVNTKYPNASEALKNYDGLLVFGTIIEVEPKDKNNTLMEKLVTHFDKMIYDKQNVSIAPFSLNSTFAVNTSEYYHYNGSLTTPGCNEAVLWVVFMKPIHMSKAQMAEFRKLRHETLAKAVNQTNYLSNNYRPLQPRNGRKIYRTFKAESSAHNIAPSITVLLASFAVIFKSF